MCLFLMKKAMSLTETSPQTISPKMYLARFRHKLFFDANFRINRFFFPLWSQMYIKYGQKKQNQGFKCVITSTSRHCNQ